MSRKYAMWKVVFLLCPLMGGVVVTLLMADPNPPTTQPADDDNAGAHSNFSYKLLTPEQISRISYMELRGIRKNDSEPDRVTVKISKDVIDEFLLSMEGHEDFRENRAKREFLKMTPPKKLHIIARYKGAEYADKVLIKSDPELFVEFKKSVLPHVLKGCATSGCHTGTNRDAKGFALLNDPKRTVQSVYSNFILLNDLKVGQQSVIDRSQPTQSLLLNYLLPRNEVQAELRHPGDVEIRPLFQSRKHNRYERILKWIESLKHPAEDYGVHLIEPKTPVVDDGEPPATQPAGQNGGIQPANP
ncbi:MAG: hypothetical protein IPK83_06240 [Planctomycetes bacterium]|nr:hypothetical protein [Planctomycetota bacterium]